MKIKTPKYDTCCVLIFFKTSELGVTEHVEGDPCKFALWVGRTPTSDNKIVLKVSMPVSFSVKLFNSVNVEHYASQCTGRQSVREQITKDMQRIQHKKLVHLP